MADQGHAIMDLVAMLNRVRGSAFGIEAEPDKVERTKPAWDYTLRNSKTGQRWGVEVTSIRRSAEAGLTDNVWARIEQELQARLAPQVQGEYLIYTSEHIESTRSTREAVVDALSHAILQMCNSGNLPAEELIDTGSGRVKIRVDDGEIDGVKLDFRRFTSRDSYADTMTAELERIILAKRDQLAAIQAAGLPPYLLVVSDNFALVSPDDVAQATLQIIRKYGLPWTGAFVWALRTFYEVDPALGYKYVRE